MPQAIRTTAAPQPTGHYSQGVRIGNFLFVSGQLPMTADGQTVSGTVGEEAAQALANVRAIVEAADGNIEDVVQCTIYISDSAYASEVNGIYGAFFGEVPVFPARVFVPVRELPVGARVQIQAIAFLNRS
jgi:2-iminobutanoate/2-iminopropanoate deaminase